MNYFIEFIFEYDEKDAQYYVLDYHVRNKDKVERNMILKTIKGLGLVSVTERPNDHLARLLAGELNVQTSAFKFTVK
ncbi:hypothetical protein ACRCJN_01450 [Aerococcus urinaeequi]|uniref:hypothetical protein n=1 Tax=Aerococcus urinaeequi TaxID=51665 RepID=UPI003D6AB409